MDTTHSKLPNFTDSRKHPGIMLPNPTMNPVHNDELEKIVIGSLISSVESFLLTRDVIDEDCFYNPDYRETYVALKNVFDSGNSPDLILVVNELKKAGSRLRSSDVAGFCIDRMVDMDIRPRAILLKEYSIRRKLCGIGWNLISKSSDISVDENEIYSETRQSLENAFDNAETTLTTLESTFEALIGDISDRINNPNWKKRYTETGFSHIDERGGLSGGNLIIIAAGTSQGKTSLATCIGMSSILQGHGVAFYSMEMTSMQLASRIASMRSGINSAKILNEVLSYDEVQKIQQSLTGIDLSLMHLDEKSTSSWTSIEMSIRSMKAKHDIKGAVIDYLQLVDVRDSKLNREQAVAKCARDMKNLAKELDIWIIALSQINRDQNHQGPPTKNRLRDSGQIEEAADLILMIYRPENGRKYPEPYSEIPTVNTAMIIADKGRNSGVFSFVCGFKPENTLFYPLSTLDLEMLKKIPSNSNNLDPFEALQEDTPF